MSISAEITRLQNAKSALATSIGNKGVTVPAATTLDGYAALVDQIQTGGGGSLPYDAQVEYIGVRQGAWTELSDYVPTGTSISIDMCVKFLGYPASPNNAIWYAARVSSSTLSYRTIGSTSDNLIRTTNCNKDGNYVEVTVAVSSGNIYNLHIGPKVLDIVGSNVNLSATINTAHSGTANTNGFQIGDYGIARGINLNVYSFTVRNQGVVVLDYIPVRKNGVGYFYDRISGNLYGKASTCTTDLVIGSDV